MEFVIIVAILFAVAIAFEFFFEKKLLKEKAEASKKKNFMKDVQAALDKSNQKIKQDVALKGVKVTKKKRVVKKKAAKKAKK